MTNLSKWMKVAGLLDGALVAALVWLGTQPGYSWATSAAQGLGVLGSILGLSHAVSASQAAPPAPPPAP
jgi:hypothetical protein